MSKHIANDWLAEGLQEWNDAGGGVYFLKGDDINIPVIEAAPVNGIEQNQTVVAVAGIHLEETSGIKYLLEPKNLLAHRQQGTRFLIFPVINQHGLQYTETSDEKLLRYDQHGRNYNDGWGKCEKSYKPNETYLIEKEIQNYVSRKKVDLCLSYHEDSDLPETGYLFTLGINKSKRKRIASGIKSRLDNRLLANFSPNDNSMGGFIEHEMMIVDEHDPRAFENWIFNELKIPTILIEGPFGCDLHVRENFQKQVTETILEDGIG